MFILTVSLLHLCFILQKFPRNITVISISHFLIGRSSLDYKQTVLNRGEASVQKLSDVSSDEHGSQPRSFLCHLSPYAPLWGTRSHTLCHFLMSLYKTINHQSMVTSLSILLSRIDLMICVELQTSCARSVDNGDRERAFDHVCVRSVSFVGSDETERAVVCAHRPPPPPHSASLCLCRPLHLQLQLHWVL